MVAIEVPRIMPDSLFAAAYQPLTETHVSLGA